MKQSKPQRGEQRVPRVPFDGEGTKKINSYSFKVPSVPLVPSIYTLVRVGAKRGHTYHNILSYLPLLCKNEGTEGTGGTNAPQIAVLWYPLANRSTLRYPLLCKMEGTL